MRSVTPSRQLTKHLLSE